MYMKLIVFGKFVLLLVWILFEYYYFLIFLYNNMFNRYLIYKVLNKINSWISIVLIIFVYDIIRIVF